LAGFGASLPPENALAAAGVRGGADAFDRCADGAGSPDADAAMSDVDASGRHPVTARFAGALEKVSS
jgi:hypothetical protein